MTWQIGLILFLIFWFGCGYLSYRRVRYCTIRKYKNWTVGDRETYLICSLLSGVPGLVICYLVVSPETPGEIEKREAAEFLRKQQPSSW